MWDILIPILTFVGGLGVGGFAVSTVVKKQMTDMQADPKQIQAIAKSMGMNLNQKQMNQITRQMQKSTPDKKATSKKKKN